MTRRDVRGLSREIDARVGRLARRVRSTGFRTAVGTSGTIEALAGVAAALEGTPRPAAGHRTLRRKALRKVTRILVASDARARQKLPGLEARRADIIACGALLLLRLMDAFGARTIAFCDRSLREGLLLDLIDRTEGAPAGDGDVRQASVDRLVERTGVDRVHAQKVRDLALRLFDRTHALHQLAAREREWLAHAALLHDAGVSIGWRRHHRHSEYLIAHGEMKGFSAEEVRVLALLARYHRGAAPRLRARPLARLDPWLRPVVLKLAALLRLAIALDRSRRQTVESVEARVTSRRVRLSLSAAAEPELELWAAAREKRLFRRVFRRKLRFDVIPAQSPARAP